MLAYPTNSNTFLVFLFSSLVQRSSSSISPFQIKCKTFNPLILKCLVLTYSSCSSPCGMPQNSGTIEGLVKLSPLQRSELKETWAMMGMGRERTRTPATAHSDPTSWDIVLVWETAEILFLVLRHSDPTSWDTQCFKPRRRGCPRLSNLAKRRRGVDVSVSDSGHRDHDPVEGSRNWRETRTLSFDMIDILCGGILDLSRRTEHTSSISMK